MKPKAIRWFEILLIAALAIDIGNNLLSSAQMSAGLAERGMASFSRFIDAKGDFNFDYEVMVKGGETAKLALALVPASESAQDNQDEEKEKKKKKCFFLTPMGIAVLVAGGALLIYGGIQLFGEEDKSPAKR